MHRSALARSGSGCGPVYGRLRAPIRPSSNLSPPTWPIKSILAKQAAYQASVDLRQVPLHNNGSIADLARLYGELQTAQQDLKALATKRNQLLKSVKKNVNTRDELQGDMLAVSKEIKQQYQAADQTVRQLEDDFEQMASTVPNLIDPQTAQVPGEFVEIDRFNCTSLLRAGSQTLHTEIGARLGLLDLAGGARVSGTGFYYLVGLGAKLEQALVHYALAKCDEFGFTRVAPPSIVRDEFVEACGFRPRDVNGEVQVYGVQGGGGPGASPLSLTGTAEIALAAQMAHRKLEKLPVLHAGVSRSYRAEAGARGADTKGLYRVHEFTKVEMFAWTSGERETSQKMFDQLVAYQRQIFEDLELPCRVIRLGPTDLGAPAYAKIDIEAWMPGRGSWGEISSVSNCLDFQSRRLHTKDATGEFVHTLNGTAMAVPRVIIAILENGWDPDRQVVRLPQRLHDFMGVSELAVPTND